MGKNDLDALTLRRAQQGDTLAFRSLVELYQRPVFAILSRMLSRVSQQQHIEDLAQETFFRVFRSLSSFSPERGRLSTWILTIATRIALDHLKKFTPSTSPLEDLSELEEEDRSAMLIERLDLGEALEAAIAQLSPGFRAVFLLREYHELSYDEIAQSLQIEVGTVKSRLLRARAALRVILQEVLDD